MDNFDYKKYLAEGRLLKEEIMVDTTIMMGGDEYLNGMFSNPEEYGIEEDEIEFVKNVISTPKMPASKFLDVFDDYWVNIIQEPGGDSQHIEQGLEDHVKGGMLSPEEAAQVMIMYWDPDGTDYGDEEKEDTLKHFQNLAEGKLLKENIEGDFETYYERWEDEDGTNEDGFFDFDEWNDGNEPGSKTDSKTWEIGFEEEDEYYGPILNNMINYLKKNKTYSYKNNDGVDAEFSLSDDERDVSMAIYYTADDIEKY